MDSLVVLQYGKYQSFFGFEPVIDCLLLCNLILYSVSQYGRLNAIRSKQDLSRLFAINEIHLMRRVKKLGKS
jgi:hypothetical protein